MKKLNEEELNELLWTVGKIQEQYVQSVEDCISELVVEEEDDNEDNYEEVSEALSYFFTYATGDGGEDRRENAKQWLIREGYIEVC